MANYDSNLVKCWNSGRRTPATATSSPHAHRWSRKLITSHSSFCPGLPPTFLSAGRICTLRRCDKSHFTARARPPRFPCKIWKSHRVHGHFVWATGSTDVATARRGFLHQFSYYRRIKSGGRPRWKVLDWIGGPVAVVVNQCCKICIQVAPLLYFLLGQPTLAGSI